LKSGGSSSKNNIGTPGFSVCGYCNDILHTSQATRNI
jgi:hypothetical protein